MRGTQREVKIRGDDEMKAFAKQILFEDKHLLLLNKKAGQLSQGAANASNNSNLVSLCTEYLQGRPPFLVHRLDRPASGVLMMTKTKSAARILSSDLRRSMIKKDYLAVVNGTVAAGETHMKSLITKSGGNKNKTLVIMNDPSEEEEGVLLQKSKHVQVAKLSFRLLENLRIPFRDTHREQSLLRIELITGRKHQIRAQLAYLGFPIVGDVKYGAQQSFNERDIALHSSKTEFIHPIYRDHVVSVTAPVPELWSRRFGEGVTQWDKEKN